MRAVPTVGVEEEFFLARSGSAELVDAGASVADDAARRDPDGQYDPEFKRSQVELATKPAATLGELADDLAGLRRTLVEDAARRGARLVASGTWPGAASDRTTPVERYESMRDRFAQVARVQLTSAMHVHVEVPDDTAGVAVVDRIAPWLPLLTALAANSPWYDGRDTGYASYRRVLWNQWPSAGPTAAFGDAATYHRTAGALVASGAAHDAAMIYFDARLSERYPTVELRVFDVLPDASHAAALAGIARGLVTPALDDDLPTVTTRIELLQGATWRASRYGMADLLADPTGEPGALVEAWQLADRATELVRPTLSPDERRTVASALADLRRTGTWDGRQRAADDPAGAVATASVH
ncbi:carboxylate-amine ligase [Jatrophihabitans fulvus]